MSSITAVGVRLGVFGPPPVPPRHSLLKTEGVLQDDTSGRWLNGVNMFPYPAPVGVDHWNPCDDETKSAVDGGEAVTWDPAAIYLEVQCTTAAIEGLKERALVSLEAGTPKAVEELVVSGSGAGVGGNTNPFLGDANVAVLGGGAVAPREGMAILEDAIAENYGGTGLIHATPGTTDLLSSILETDDTGTIYTQAGTPVVSGFGYVGAEANSVAPGDQQAWMFASPPMEVYLTDPVTTDLRSSLDRGNNEVSFIVERFALAYWDIAALQVAVLVDWALASS